MNKIKITGAIVLVGFLAYYAYKRHAESNPFDQVEWIEDSPGATERYITFTPILKSNKRTIGPTVGADYGVLTFKDIDDDGIKEAIIETEKSIHFEFYSAQRHVLKFKNDEVMGPRFEYVEGPELKEE